MNSEYKSLQPRNICFQNKKVFYKSILKLLGKLQNNEQKHSNSELLKASEENEMKYYKLQNNRKKN